MDPLRGTPADRPPWELRFHAPRATLPRWARLRPGRCLYTATISGAWQVHLWDRADGRHRRATDGAIGTVEGWLTPDGERVLWFADATGDETGEWLGSPFDGGAAEPLLPGAPAGWSAGLACGHRWVAAGIADRDGFQLLRRPLDGSRPVETWYRHRQPLAVVAVSPDDQWVCVSHSEHGDAMHPALRVHRLADGAAVADLWDGPGAALATIGWSPEPGDPRLAVTEERSGWARPAIWDARGGARDPLAVGLDGDVEAVAWYPDGRALLVRQHVEGRHRLHRVECGSGRAVPLPHPAGTIPEALVRPDGVVWYRWSDGAHPSTLCELSPDGRAGPLIELEGRAAPPGRPYRTWSFPNPDGDRVRGFVVDPGGAGPHPTVVWVHGGPAMAMEDSFHPAIQAWADHGFQVAVVNYRGSTGRGAAWRDRLIGDPGFPEVADVAAGLDDLVARGWADPARAVLIGGSWGGYVTLLALGLHPGRFAAAIALVPVADYPLAYADESEELQAFDRTLFGGSPEQAPDRYRERSPSTYADAVVTPLRIEAATSDSRCPIDQVRHYVDRMRERGALVEYEETSAGHGTFVVDAEIGRTRRALAFAIRHVRPGP